MPRGRTARLFAGVVRVRPDAVSLKRIVHLFVFSATRSREHVPLLRDVGPVLIINTIVVVAAAQRGLVRRPVAKFYIEQKHTAVDGLISVSSLGGSAFVAS